MCKEYEKIAGCLVILALGAIPSIETVLSLLFTSVFAALTQ